MKTNILPLEVAALGKRYKSTPVLRDVSFTLAKQEVLGFLGENGAGKTTALRIIVGLLRQSSGHVRVLGEQVPAPAETMKHVGYLAEDPRFYDWLSARENLTCLLEPIGVARAEIDEALDRLGLLSRATDRVSKFSHGMRRRLGIARAICGGPQLLVLDEPANGLDPGWVRELRSIIDQQRQSGAAVILSSHQLTEVEKSCDRVVVLREGRVVLEGAVSDLVRSQGSFIVGVTEGDLELALEALREYPVERLDPSHLRVAASAGIEISRRLIALGIAPESITPEPQSLESVFFDA